MLNLVVVEDHELTREELIVLLRRQGWHVDGADCGEQLNALLLQKEYHIAILDLNLPHEDGLSIASRLKNSHPNLGLIMLTARTRSVDRQQGYQSGADVYLNKPLNPDELIAVVANLFNRLAPRPATELTLHSARNVLTTQSGQSCKLTANETMLLKMLALMPEREAETSQILEVMSRKSDPDLNRDNLTVMVSRLRTKTMALSLSGSLITAVRGFGYRLNLPLTIAQS
ncbi:MAG: response regulator transcription factor [Limnobacter sp.]|nr:response regulator transcription factor [Limnobacter sp.]